MTFYKKNKSLDYLLVFIFCSFSRFISIPSLCYGVPSSDEVSAISVAALLSGYDWSDVVSNAGYYGIGYMWIFFPLYRYGFSAELIYKIVCAMSAILIGLTGCISYRIIDKFFKDISRWSCVFISIFSGGLSVLCTYGFSERNEEILLFISWLLAYVMFSMFIEENNIKKQLVLICLIAYSLTVHSRSIIYIIAIIILCVLYFIVEKKLLIKGQLIIMLIVLTVILLYALKIYQRSIWHTGSIRNASVSNSISNGLQEDFLNRISMQAMLMIFIGHMFTAIEMTGCAYAIAIMAICAFIVYEIKGNISNERRPLLWIGLFWLICTMGIVAGLCISWRPGVYHGLLSGTTEWVYGYKALTYMRYPGPYMPPFILCGIILLLRADKKTKRNVSIATLIMTIFCVLFWKLVIEPYAITQRIEVMYFLSWIKDGQNLFDGWQLTYKLMLGFGIVWIMIINRDIKYLNLYLVIMSVLFSSMKICNFRNTNLFNVGFVGEVRETADLLNKISDNDRKFINESSVYVIDNSDLTDHQRWYRLQYICYKIHFIPGLPDNIDEDNIVLSNTTVDDLDINGYEMVELNPYEYIYYKGERYHDIVADGLSR